MYKSKRYALKTKRVWSRHSSHECPRCGETGVTCKSPEHRHSIPYGH
ncbi:MAG: transposase [Anaerolineae bacterium]|nr:transposase [Anaerolineae bacterium]